MVVRVYALILGAILVILGLAGLFTADVLLGLQITTLHDWVHLVTGVPALVAGFLVGATGVFYSRLYAQVFGVVYTIVALWGFAAGTAIGLFPVGAAENILHLVIGVSALLVGFTGLGLLGTRAADLPGRLRKAA